MPQMSVPSMLTLPLFGRRIPEIMLSMVVLPLPDGPDHIEHLAEMRLEAHVAHRVGLGLAFAEPLVEPLRFDGIARHAHPLKMSKGSILSTLRTPM